MKIVVAPDSFKGSVSASGACDAIASGLRRVVPDADIVSIPMADGGEGTVDALVASTKGNLREVEVIGPLAQPIKATYGITGDEGKAERTAVIEMAAAAGLPLVPIAKRNPLYTTTYGLGQLINDAIGQGCRKFIIGIGGSATNDCGTGMAQALGVKFYDNDKQEITDYMTGDLMGQVASVDTSGLALDIDQCEFVIACDVSNPLLGPNGAGNIYGPQKGADPATIELLETNMAHIITLIEDKVHRVVRDIAGAGAAGGLGAGIMTFLNGSLEQGVEIVMRYSRFAQKIRGADLIITGEGKIDATTVSGKTIAGIAAVAQAQSIPVIALAGLIDTEAFEKIRQIGIKAIFSICPGPISLPQAMKQAPALLADTAEQVLRTVLSVS